MISLNVHIGFLSITIGFNTLIGLPVYTNFRGSHNYFMKAKPERLFFADHQVEYIVSLSHCFFSRMKTLCSASLQQYV